MEGFPASGHDRPDRLIVWKADGEHCRVICAASFLESVRTQCVRAARGPVPLGIGGALMGEISSGEFHIHHWYPIPCRYQRGPSFLLTKEEVAGLKDFLAQLPARSGTGEHVLIGWFVSHPFRGAEIRDDEISLHQRFFRSSDLFLLIEVQPDGALEVVVHRGARPMQPVWRIVPTYDAYKGRPIPETPSIALPPARPHHFLEDEDPMQAGPKEEQQAPSRGPMILALSALTVTLGAAAWLYWDREPPPAPPPPPVPQPVATLSLRVQRQERAFLIRWNPVEPSLTTARQVILRITDGAAVVEHPLSQATVRAGSFTHNSSSSSLEVEMRAELPDGRAVSEKVIYGQ
jgi:hypothetical protein